MLKDTKANKVFLIILVVLLALGFTASRGWNVRNRDSRINESIDFATTDSLKVPRFQTILSSRWTHRQRLRLNWKNERTACRSRKPAGA
jgi:hypothetical protein